MKKLFCALLAAATLALCGCGSFLERTYSSSQPHSATYYESEDRSVLRAEGYQDLVNDILLLVGENAKEGTIWLYNTSDSDTQDAGEAARRACQEVQTQTPMGAYMVDYLTCKTSTGSRNYTQIDLTIGYRRTAEQAAAIVHATSVSALHDLLTEAAAQDKSELVVSVEYFDRQEQQVRQTVAQVRQEITQVTGREPAAWEVNFYPTDTNPGIIEIILRSSAKN